MITNLKDAVETYGVDLLEHLDHDADIPVVAGTACQGDVSIWRQDDRAAATTAVPKTGVAVVRGENGGNTHSLHNARCFFDASPERGTDSLELGTLTVPAGEQALLSHPEHGGLLLEPGTYRIGRQREYAGEWRQVAD